MAKLRNPEKIYGLSFTKKEIKDAKKNNTLLTLDLETSHACNLKCIYCYASSGKKLKNELTLKEIKGIIDQAKDCGAKIINIIGGGEPLLYDGILDIVKHIRKLGLQQAIFTNGTLFTEKLAKTLYDQEVELVVKLNSLNPEVQDMLADKKGSGKKILKALDLLQKIGYTKDIQLGVESIICKQNIKEMPTMWRWARDREIIPYFEMITFQGRAKQHDLNVGIKDLQKLFEELLRIDEANYGFTWNPHPPIAGLSCQRHFYNVLVASNGYVYPCTGVDIKLGNLRHDKLSDIIKHSPMLKPLRDLDKNIQGSCKECDYSSECYGCRGMAYHLEGNCFASDPLCWNNERRIHIAKDGTMKKTPCDSAS
ncbi:radical SAM/SPASM domain-containing protein [Thermodesulfobacteriota bacterium]